MCKYNETMTDEEKNAIEHIKSFCNIPKYVFTYEKTKLLVSIQIVLNIIEKQQKEIEKLKHDLYYKQGMIDELTQMEEEHKMLNGALRKELEELKQMRITKTLKNLSDYDIKLISEECGKELTPIIQNEMKRQIENDYILKTKIEEKIEELEDCLDLCINDGKVSRYKTRALAEEIKDLKELLESE